jgi:hypothetical protein
MWSVARWFSYTRAIESERATDEVRHAAEIQRLKSELLREQAEKKVALARVNEIEDRLHETEQDFICRLARLAQQPASPVDVERYNAASTAKAPGNTVPERGTRSVSSARERYEADARERARTQGKVVKTSAEIKAEQQRLQDEINQVKSNGTVSTATN